jgi:hypothetical protein
MIASMAFLLTVFYPEGGGRGEIPSYSNPQLTGIENQTPPPSIFDRDTVTSLRSFFSVPGRVGGWMDGGKEWVDE